MPFNIVRGDITKMNTDAIVNAANTTLLGGGGVDGAIHRAAGPELLKECMTLGGCKMGQAKVTKGYDLSCKYIIHTVGPIWNGGGFGEEQILRSCYKNSLELAEQLGCRSVAFPLISAGVYGYPIQQAIEVALSAINEYLGDSEMQVTLMMFGGRIVAVNDTEFESIKQYISENLVGQFATRRRRHAADDAPAGQEQAAPPPPRGGETLVQAVTRLTSELELDDKELCRRANISGSLLGKIRSDGRFRLTRSEVIGLASAFDLDCEGAGQLLQLAGLPPFSMSDRADVILRYLFENDCCDILTINRALFSFDAL